MLQNQSIINTADNSGAKKVYMIKPIGLRNSRFVYINGLVKVSVRSLRKKGNISVKVGCLYVALLVRTCVNLSRFSGNYICFFKNRVIMLNIKKNLLPYGTRIFGGVTRELRIFKHLRILILASVIY